MLRRTLTLAPLLLCVTLWPWSYWRSPWARCLGYGAGFDRGALYAFSAADTSTRGGIDRSSPTSIEELAGETVRRWAPVRVLRPTGWPISVMIIPLWVPAIPAALLAWWGWRPRRVAPRRGFEVSPPSPAGTSRNGA